MRYTRHQLLLLLALLAAAAAGLAIRHWRAAYPELAARLERFDRDAGAGEAGTTAEVENSAKGAARASPPASPVGRPTKLGQASTAAPEPRLDLNRASAGDLSRLPGVGAVLAARIVHAREAAGPFASVEDLRRVSGVGRAKLERLRPLVTVGE